VRECDLGQRSDAVGLSERKDELIKRKKAVKRRVTIPVILVTVTDPVPNWYPVPPELSTDLKRCHRSGEVVTDNENSGCQHLPLGLQDAFIK